MSSAAVVIGALRVKNRGTCIVVRFSNRFFFSFQGDSLRYFLSNLERVSHPVSCFCDSPYLAVFLTKYTRLSDETWHVFRFKQYGIIYDLALYITF